MNDIVKIKPTSIWPIWVFYGIMFVVGMIDGGNPQAVTNLLVVAIVLSVIIHIKNKKNFGKDYLKNPKPTKEILEKSKNISFALNKNHRIIIYSLTFFLFTIGLLTGGILGGLLLGLGVNLFVDGIIRLINKKKDSKVIISVIIGILLIIGGVWFVYGSLRGAIDAVTDKYMQKCEAYCSSSAKANSESYSLYSVEFDKSSKSFICYCMTETKEVVDKISSGFSSNK